MQIVNKVPLDTFDASNWRIGIVVAQFNNDITKQLEISATDRASGYNIKDENIDIARVAGAIELPLVLQQMAKSKKYDALLAVGCVIEGDTPHFTYVCQFVTEGILRVQLDHSMPIGFGVLTCRTKEQAASRANLGSEHLDAVLHQAKILKSMKS